jgi:FtsZ-interacting cell division protein ZipA
MSNKGVSKMGVQKSIKKGIIWGLVMVEAIATITICLIGSRTFGHNYETNNTSSVKNSKITINDKENVVKTQKEKNTEPAVTEETKAESSDAAQEKQQKSNVTASPSNIKSAVQQTSGSKKVTKTTQKSAGSQQPAEQTTPAQATETSTPPVPAIPPTSPAPEPSIPATDPTIPNGDQPPVIDPATETPGQGETTTGTTPATP